MDAENTAKHLAKYAGLLRKQRISEEQYQYNVLTVLLTLDELHWERVLNTIPIDLIRGFRDYFQQAVVEWDYSPDFVFGIVNNDRETIAARKKELKPKYQRFHAVLQNMPCSEEAN